jgi:acyl-CoA reductase-like NAD-dependent aldehyde dehydrogenase
MSSPHNERAARRHDRRHGSPLARFVAAEESDYLDAVEDFGTRKQKKWARKEMKKIDKK